MSRLENELKELEVRLGEWNKFWRERVAYISIIVGLIVALVIVTMV